MNLRGSTASGSAGARCVHDRRSWEGLVLTCVFCAGVAAANAEGAFRSAHLGADAHHEQFFAQYSRQPPYVPLNHVPHEPMVSHNTDGLLSRAAVSGTTNASLSSASSSGLIFSIR